VKTVFRCDVSIRRKLYWKLQKIEHTKELSPMTSAGLFCNYQYNLRQIGALHRETGMLNLILLRTHTSRRVQYLKTWFFFKLFTWLQNCTKKSGNIVRLQGAPHELMFHTSKKGFSRCHEFSLFKFSTVVTCVVFQHFPGSNSSIVNNIVQSSNSKKLQVNSRHRDNP